MPIGPPPLRSPTFPATRTARNRRPLAAEGEARYKKPVARRDRLFNLRHLSRPDAVAGSPVDDRHRTGPAGGRAFDLDRETGDGETGRRQLLEVVQLLDVAIADVASGLVTFPDQTGVPGLGVFLRGVDKRRVPEIGRAHV